MTPNTQIPFNTSIAPMIFKNYKELAKRLFSLSILSTLIGLTACEDNTDQLGVDIMPASDFVTRNYRSYDVVTRSYEVGDSVLARSSMSYLGRFTDPETGTVVKSDFLAQFHCSDTFSFPDSIKNHDVTSTELRLYVKGYMGDSLANFKLSVYPLNKVLDPDKDYYTNIKPELYYDATSAPIATKWFSLSDRTISDDERTDKNYNRSIRIALPKEVGQAVYDTYRTNPEVFTNTETYLNSDLPCSKGFYFKIESGDGAMAYIDVAQLNMNYIYYDNEFEKDTAGISQFASTEEVVQATRFDNEQLDRLMADGSATYLKSPAGIFTLATLPTDEINMNDTINSAKLTFTRYNDLVEAKFKLSIPQTLLLVRLDDYLNGFFENYMLADNVTSFVTRFSSSTNAYVFDNIAKLVAQIMKEKREGTATENADKVLLIPVEATYDSNNNLVKLSHDFSMASARLVGGDTDRVKLDVIYSRYNQ